MADTGIELKQLTNWFVNNRKRYWKPRVEARLQHQAAAAAQAHAAAVAAVTAVSHTNPVSPDHGFKPTLTVPGNGVVTFDLCTTAHDESSSERYSHLVGTDLSRVLADKQSCANMDVRTVSETSSSSSVSTSEGEESDSSAEDDHGLEVSEESVTDLTSAQETQETDDGSLEQTSGESSSSETTAYRPLHEILKRALEQETVQIPRKKFRRVSLELWRATCKNASGVYDEDLPSLEEATQLFGYGC